MIYPKFSIIIPCYNQEEFIHECYISIVSQSYRNWEAIFINDGSTDNTETLLQRIKQFDERVTIVSKPNGGLSSARNAGIEIANSHFVIFLDADDMLLPNCLKKIKYHIFKKPETKFIQYGYRHISQDDRNVYNVVIPKISGNLLPHILYNNIGPVHSVCIEKNTLKDIGFFDEKLKSCEDWDLWIRTAFNNISLDILSESLVDYRMNDNSMSRNSFVLYNAMEQVTISAHRKYIENLNDSKLKNLNELFIKGLKQKLCICLGVAIIQNKISDAVNLFVSKTKENHLSFNYLDFTPMRSYLTFRYKTSNEDLKIIFDDYKKKFELFFREIGYSKQEIKKCIWAVFSKHYYIYYTNKLGYCGKVLYKFKLQLV